MRTQKKLSILILVFSFTGIFVILKPEKPTHAIQQSYSPVFQEWQSSGHANSLKSLILDPDADWTCLRCHSADYKNIQLKFSRSDGGSLPDPSSVGNPVTCSSCHKSKNCSTNDLVKSADKLCLTCHKRFCGT